MSSRSAELHAWRFLVDERWISAAISMRTRTPRLNARDDAPCTSTDLASRASRQSRRSTDTGEADGTQSEPGARAPNAVPEVPLIAPRNRVAHPPQLPGRTRTRRAVLSHRPAGGSRDIVRAIHTRAALRARRLRSDTNRASAGAYGRDATCSRRRRIHGDARKSASVRSLLRWLHEKQAKTRLLKPSVPPRHFGTRWSTVR